MIYLASSTGRQLRPMATSDRRILQILGNQMAAAQFRRSAQGWIFRAPTPWVLGPRPHYRVQEAQKARIEKIVGAGHLAVYMLLILATAWFVLSATIAPALGIFPDFEDRLLVFVACCVLPGILHNLYQYLALRPIVRMSPRVAEQITLVERLGPLAMYSRGVLISSFLFFLAMLLFLMYSAFSSRWDALSYVGIVAVGWMAIFYGAVLWVKWRLSGRPRG